MTPFFMPDATRAVAKGLTAEELRRTGICALVVNTYHLYLQPGMEIIGKAGGCNRFMGWNGPLLSDSGGYQVFSLIHKNRQMGKICDEHVEFRSPIDGSRHILTPEKSIQIQFDLGVDMMVCLDDCPPNDFSRKDLEKSVARTIAWAKRCKREYLKQAKKRNIKESERPLLFAVIQGGTEIGLREYCAEELVKLDFDGYGFGGRHVDKNGVFLGDVLRATVNRIPEDKLRFALGVGTPEDISLCANMGWDMFDCVIPTREGRHGRLFEMNSEFRIPNFESIKDIRRSALKNRHLYITYNITNAEYKNDLNPISKDSDLTELREYSRAYLHHLFKVGDPLGPRLASLNNLEVYAMLIAILGRAIKTE